MWNRRLWVGILIAAGLIDSLLGQTKPDEAPRGSVSGRILDPMGAVIPNSRVRLVVLGGGDVLAETKTDEAGLFLFSAVPANEYGVWVQARGFIVAAKRVGLQPGRDTDVGSIMLTPMMPPDVIVLTEWVAMSDVAGRISDRGGADLPCAQMTLRNATYRPQVVSSQSDRDGGFRFRSAEIGIGYGKLADFTTPRHLETGTRS